MKRTIFTISLAISGAFSANFASASTLLDWGNETFDTATNLAWLDLTFTNGLSMDAALLAHSNFRAATIGEVVDLYGNAGLPSPNQNNFVNASAANDLINLLGSTFTSAIQIGTQGMALGTGGVRYTDPFVTVINGTDGRTYRGLAETGWLTSSFSVDGVGAYLVRDADPVSEVPLPASGFLLLAGLAGSFGLRLFQRS